MANLVALQKANDKRWIAAKVTRKLESDRVAKRIIPNKSRYVDIVRRCRAVGSKMPDSAWLFVAIAHYRESNLDFSTHLGQGDPLNKKTTHVPAGRGPFFGADAFERGAVDALVDCAPKAAMSNKDWSISGMLTYWERYNGLAYANQNVPSPYIWSGTDQYKSGKVTRDHGPIEWDVVDKQLGCAAILLSIMALDPESRDFTDIVSPPIQPDLPVVDLVPVEGVFDTVWLQWALNELGATPRLSVDGIYGGATRTAVKAFQKSNNLKVDGIAGTAETIPAIKKALLVNKRALAKLSK
jgi:lysozyme family protein